MCKSRSFVFPSIKEFITTTFLSEYHDLGNGQKWVDVVYPKKKIENRKSKNIHHFRQTSNVSTSTAMRPNMLAISTEIHFQTSCKKAIKLGPK